MRNQFPFYWLSRDCSCLQYDALQKIWSQLLKWSEQNLQKQLLLKKLPVIEHSRNHKEKPCLLFFSKAKNRLNISFDNVPTKVKKMLRLYLQASLSWCMLKGKHFKLALMQKILPNPYSCRTEKAGRSNYNHSQLLLSALTLIKKLK